MKCYRCGAELDKKSDVCPGCGANVVTYKKIVIKMKDNKKYFIN